jgi:hypothetical protein
MGILVANDGSRIVNTVNDRNEITKRFPGMKVTVNDATGDPEFGGGVVQYQWDAIGNRWAPVWSDRKPELKFATEEKVIANGQVTADNPVKDQKVWSALIINSVTGEVMGDVVPSINANVISVGSLDYEGHKLRYTYAFGNMTQYMTDIWNQKANTNSPEFTGNPTAPTPALDSNDDSLATTAFIALKLQGFEGGTGTVKSVNGAAPDAEGNVTVDVGVLTVNGSVPDATGNVNVQGGVTAVNEQTPDETGNITLTAGNLGLGSVPNYPAADTATMIAGTSAEHLATPSATMALLADAGITRDAEGIWTIPGGDVEEAPSADPAARFLRDGTGNWSQLVMADPATDMQPGTTEALKPVSPQALEAFLQSVGIYYDATAGDWIIDQGTLA